MFTLKLYKNGPLPGGGRTVIMEVAGVWSDHCENGIKYLRAFKKVVGVMDEDGTPDIFVGGTLPEQFEPNSAIVPGAGGNYYDWGVLENAQGKTTEMFR